MMKRRFIAAGMIAITLATPALAQGRDPYAAGQVPRYWADRVEALGQIKMLYFAEFCNVSPMRPGVLGAIADRMGVSMMERAPTINWQDPKFPADASAAAQAGVTLARQGCQFWVAHPDDVTNLRAF